MANDEFTGEEIEQLKQAAHEAVFSLLFLADGLWDSQRLALRTKQLLDRFPVLRRVMWDQRYARRVQKEYGDEALPALTAIKQLVQEIPHEDADDPHLHIYTDGGCSGNPGPGGIGVVWIYGDTREVLEHWEAAGPKATNSYVELLAVQRALVLLSDEDLKKTITLHTDSQYVYNMLVKNYRAKANRELIAEILGLMEGLDIEILKVPGHEKVWANERADKLAKQGVNESRRAVIR